MPRKTPEAIREYNQAYYKANREAIVKKVNERYHNDDEFYERHKRDSKKWYHNNNIRERRLIQRNFNRGICIMPTDQPLQPKVPKKPKSSLQLKRERIEKALRIVDEKARIFREKLNSKENIYDAPKIENEPATDNSTCNRPFYVGQSTA
jgi:hypothetical protein